MSAHSAIVITLQIDPLDVFSLSRTRGVLAPSSTQHVTVTFKAAAPANYWRRVACLIKDAEPASLDLVATTFTDKSRPPPLGQRHVDRYLARVAAGGAPVTEEQLDSKPPSAAAGLYAEAGEMGGGSGGGGGGVGGGDGMGEAEGGGAGTLGRAGQQAAAAVTVGPESWELVFGGQVRCWQQGVPMLVVAAHAGDCLGDAHGMSARYMQTGSCWVGSGPQDTRLQATCFGAGESM